MHELSPLERRVLEGLGRGDLHKTIAADVSDGRPVSIGTIATLAHRARQKLHVESSEAAVRKARRLGLIR